MSFARLRSSLASASPAYLALGCFGLAASPALAQEAQDATASRSVNLGGVTVSDTAVDDAGIKVDQVSSPKFTQKIQDTPQTIQVISKDLFNQQGATTLTEALRNTPGVGTYYVGENGSTSTGDALYMRGFDVSNSIFVDGVRDIGSISRDIFNIDQIEVEKGPAGTDNGRTAPAGAINLVSKKALTTEAMSAIITGGTDGQKRASVDMNHKLDDDGDMAFRLNAVWQDSDVAGRDHVKNKRVGLAPSFGIGLTGPTRLYVNFLYVDQNNTPDGGVPTVGLPSYTGFAALEGHRVDSSNFYGTRADHDHVDAKMATAQFEHDFSDKIKLTNITRWGRTAEDYLLSSFTLPIAGTDPTNLSQYTLTGNANVKDVWNSIVTDQLMVRADVKAGGIENNIVAGVEVTREAQMTHGVTATNALTPQNLYNPTYDDTGTISVSRNGTHAKGVTNTYSAYLFDTAKFFGDKLLITGGLRVDHYKTSYFANVACGGTARGAVACPDGTATGTIITSTDLSKRGTLFNWKIGAVYKPIEILSVYADYALSQQPPGGDNFSLSSSTTSLENPDLKPEKAKTLEAGVKASLFDNKLLATAAVFRTQTDNEIDSTNLDDNGNATQSGHKVVKGVELSATGNITQNWSLLLGYTYQKAKVKDLPTVTADGSPNLTYTPGNAFTSWTTYRLPFGVTLGGGVRHTGGLHRQSDSAVGTPAYTKAYTVVDAIVSYQLTKNVALRLNAYNLFDKNYVAAINKSGYRYTPGTPRTFLFNADVRF